MKSLLPASLIILILAGGACLTLRPTKQALNRPSLAGQEQHESRPADGIREWAEYEFNLLKNPVTGTIPNGTFAEEWAQALATEKLHNNSYSGSNAKASSFGTWSFKGPNNLGGRTRAIGIDVNNNNIILAGNVSGGVCRSTDGGLSWTNVTPTYNIKNITSIAQDTRSGQTSTWYLCTGEGFGNSVSGTAGPGSAFYLGNGVYKSTDNGITWARLTGSNAGADESFDDARDICWRVAVNPANGDVYLAASNAIYRSANGGLAWSPVLSATLTNSGQATDVVITTGGTIYAAISGNSGDATKDGVWTSTNGTSWTRLSGLISAVQTPSTWNAVGAYGRMVLALAPSSQTTLYALYYNNTTSSCLGTAAPEAELFKYDASIPSWTDLSANLPDESGCKDGNDPFAVQGGYDLCIAVKPDNASTVFIGGTNVYRSTTGFTTNGATTRIGGYASPAGYALYTNHHSDIHELKFASGSNDVLYTGDDGGIQKSDVTAGTPAWTSLNNSYPSYQYYKVALDPTTGSSLAIGGAQDNGTTYMNSASTTGNFYFSGDGGSVGTTAGGGVFYFSTQNGSAYRGNTAISIEPATSKTLFVTNFYLDPDNTSFLYYANGNDLYRTASASTTTTSSGWTLLSGLATSVGASKKIYGITTSRGTYSTNTGAPATLSRLYVGTDNGQLFRLDDPQNVSASTSPADITPTGMATGGTLVDIAVHPTDSRKVMAVYSNYGVNSVWYTNDASAASPVWANVEGNISAFSFRSVVILSNGTLTNYVVGTSKGIYSTATLNGSSTTWFQEASNTIGYVPVLDLAYRTADQTMLAGTHGNGMFLTTNFPLPLRFISFTASAQSSDDVGLNWTVNGAERIEKFVVQRSADGQHWESVVTIAGDGNTKVSSYTANDHLLPKKGTLYYRIRATEQSGDGYYSAIVPVNLPNGNTSNGVYPTIVNQYLNIDAEDGGLTAVLTDMQGRRIASVNLTLGRNTENLSALPAGHYVVSIYKGSQLTKTARIIKQ